MDDGSWVFGTGDAVRGWGHVLEDADGAWLEPDSAVALHGGTPRRRPGSFRLVGHDRDRVATAFGSDGRLPGWATVTGSWLGDAIGVTATSPVPCTARNLRPSTRGPGNPLSHPALTAARDDLAPHRAAWGVIWSSARLDPQGGAHLAVEVGRVLPEMAEWAARQEQGMVHLTATVGPLAVWHPEDPDHRERPR